MATTTKYPEEGGFSMKQSRIGIATLRFQNRKYQFPSIIVRNNGKQQCIMLDVCLLCPFCTGDINARIIPLESRVLLAQGQNRHSYPPAGPDVVMQCEDLATSFAQQFPHLLSPRTREHLAHCNVADRLSQSADENMLTESHNTKAQVPLSTRLKSEQISADSTQVKSDRNVPVPGQTLNVLDSTDAEGDSTQTSDTDSVESVRYVGDKYSTVKRAFPHDVIRGVIAESPKEESEGISQETVKRSSKPPLSPKSSPKQKKRGSRSPSSDSNKKSDENKGNNGERTTAVVVKTTIHQTVAELLDLPSESDGEDTDDKDKSERRKKVLSLDNIRSASQLSDYGSMESMSNSHERLHRSRSEGMGSMDSSLHSTKKVDALLKSEIKAAIGNVKELPESVTKEFMKLRSQLKKTKPDGSWSFDDLRELYKGAHLSSVPFRHSQGDNISTVYPVFDFRREASPRNRQEGDTAHRSPRTSQANVATQPGSASANVILANQPPQLDVNANIDSTMNMNVPNSQLRQEAAANVSDDRDADETGIEDAEKEMERVVGEMTSLEAELEQMYRMTAKSRQQRPVQDGEATNLGDSSTTLTSLQERQRIEQEELERMQELEDERRRPFVAEPKPDNKKPNVKKDKQAKRVPREEAQFEEEERRVQLWLREQQKRQKILQKQNLTQQDRRRLQMLNEQRRQQFLQERLRLQLEARGQQVQPPEQNIPSAISPEDYKRREKIKAKLQRQAEQLHQMQMQALYQQQSPNERQAEMQWQAIQDHHRRILQEQEEIASQNANRAPQEHKVKPPVPPKPKFAVPRVANLAKKDETPPQVRRMRNVMSFLESSSNEALQDNPPRTNTAQGQTLESSTSSSAAESYKYQHLYEEEAMASLENEDLNFYDEENDRVIDRTGDVNKVEEAECLIQDPEHVYAQHIQAKDISQMLDILERVVDGSKKRKKDDDAQSGSSSSDDEDADVPEKDPEETVDEILENIDTDSYSPNATLSRVFTQPRKKKATMRTVEELEPVAMLQETDDQTLETSVDAVLESMEGVEEFESSQLFESVIEAEPVQKKEITETKAEEIVEEVAVPESAQLTAADLVPQGLEEKRSSSTECLPDDNTSLEMERSICYSENTSETTSYDEDSLDLQVAEAKLSKESSAEIKQMIVKTTALTDDIIQENQQHPEDYLDVRLRMLSPIMEEKSNRSSFVSNRSSGVLSDGRSPRSSDFMTDSKSNRSSAMSSDLLTDLSSDKRSSRSTDIVLSNRSSAALSNRSSQGLESPPTDGTGAQTPTWAHESFESQVPVQRAACVTPAKSEDSGDILLDDSMIVEQISRSQSTSPGDHALLTSSESESGASLQRRIWSRNQHQLSPYAYEYGEAVGHEMREPVHIRLYPSVEDMAPYRLPPEQVDHQLTVITDSLSLDNYFQEGKPAVSPRSPQILSPVEAEYTSSSFLTETADSEEAISPMSADTIIRSDQMDFMVETTENTESMAVKDTQLVIIEETSKELEPPVNMMTKSTENTESMTMEEPHLVIAEVTSKEEEPSVTKEVVTGEVKMSESNRSIENTRSEQAAGYTMAKQSLDIIEITTEVNKKQLTPAAKVVESNPQPETNLAQPDVISDIQESRLSRGEVEVQQPENIPQDDVVENQMKEKEVSTESVEVSSPVEVIDEVAGQPKAVAVSGKEVVVAPIAQMDSSSESLDISSEEDEITNVIELLHKVKQEFEAQIPKYEGPLPESEVTEKETEVHDEKPLKSDSDSGSEVVIDDSGSGDVFKIKLDRQSSLRFQRLSRENSLRDETMNVDDISEEYAFNMHVRSLERLGSFSREALNVSSEGSAGEKEPEETEDGTVTVVKKEKEAINRLESLITVDSEPQTPEDIRYSSGLDAVLLEGDLGVPLEMTSSGLFPEGSMESIEEVDEKVEETEEDEVANSVDLERSISQTSQLDIIIEEEDLASQASSPSKRSTDASESTVVEDNESAETSSSFAISEGSNNSGQPDLLHNVIVCAGAKMTPMSDSDIPMDSDSSSDGFGSMKASTLKIRLTDKKPPIHPQTEIKLVSTNTREYAPYGDIVLGRDDRESTPEAEMAIFNFKDALAMFEDMSQNPRTGDNSDEVNYAQLQSNYVTRAIRSHERFVKEATFGIKTESEVGQDQQMPSEVTTEEVMLEIEDVTQSGVQNEADNATQDKEKKAEEGPSDMEVEESPVPVGSDQAAIITTEVTESASVTGDMSEHVIPTGGQNIEIIVSEAFEEEDIEGEILHAEAQAEKSEAKEVGDKAKEVEDEAKEVEGKAKEVEDKAKKGNPGSKDGTPDNSPPVKQREVYTTDVQDTETVFEDLSTKESSPGVVETQATQVITEAASEDHPDLKMAITEQNTQVLEEQLETSNAEELQPVEDEKAAPTVQEVDVIQTKDLTQEIIPSCAKERSPADVENVREISPVSLAACDGEEVLISLEKAEQKDIAQSHADQIESTSEEAVEAMRGSSPAEPELFFHEKELSTVQDVSQEESMVSETGELINADSYSELSSRESEASDVTVIMSSTILDSRDDLTQEPTRVEEMASPSPDKVSMLSSSEDVSAEEVATPVQNILSSSVSSQETSFVLERQESLSVSDVRNLTPVPTEATGKPVVELHSPDESLVDFERSLSSQEASFVLERNDSASDTDVREITPVPEDAIDVVAEVVTKPGTEVPKCSAPDICIADYDNMSSFRSDDYSGSETDKRSTIDSQKSAISLIHAVSKSSDTEEVVSVSPDVTQISLLEQQAEYQRYKDDVPLGICDQNEQSSSSVRSSVNSNQERFETNTNVSKQEGVSRATPSQQTGNNLVQPGASASEEVFAEIGESDSFDDLHRSPSFMRNKPRRSPSTSSSEKTSLTYSQERSFETSFDAGQPVTEWHASRTATYETKGNVVYHEESQISSDTEGSLRRRKKVLIKRPSTEGNGNQYETQTFVQEDVSPTPPFQAPCNIAAMRTDSVSEGEEGDDEKELSASSSGSGSREGSFIRYSSAEDVNDILDKVRAVVFEASKYQQESSQAETNEQSNGDIPEDSMSESCAGASEQDIKDYFIKKEDEELKKKQAETEEFLRNLLHRHHHEHVSKESSRNSNKVTDISACLEEVCRAMSESDSDEIVVEEDIDTQEVTLVFAWPKSSKPVFQYPDRPYREICMRRITKIRDFDIDVVEGPALDSITASGSQSDSNKTSASAASVAEQPASSKDNFKTTAAESDQCQTQGETKKCTGNQVIISGALEESNNTSRVQPCMVPEQKPCVASGNKPMTNKTMMTEINIPNLSSSNYSTNLCVKNSSSVSVCIEGSGNCGENDEKEERDAMKLSDMQGTKNDEVTTGNKLTSVVEKPAEKGAECKTSDVKHRAEIFKAGSATFVDIQTRKSDEEMECKKQGTNKEITLEVAKETQQSNNVGDVSSRTSVNCVTHENGCSKEAIEEYASQLCQVVLANAIEQIKAIYQQVEEKIAECKGAHSQRRLLAAFDLGVPNSPVPIKRNVSKRQAPGDLGITDIPVLPEGEEYLVVQKEVTAEEKWTSPMQFMERTSAIEVITENVRQETVGTEVSEAAARDEESGTRGEVSVTGVEVSVTRDEASETRGEASTTVTNTQMSQSMHDSGIECQESRDTMERSFGENQLDDHMASECAVGTVGVVSNVLVTSKEAVGAVSNVLDSSKGTAGIVSNVKDTSKGPVGTVSNVLDTSDRADVSITASCSENNQVQNSALERKHVEVNELQSRGYTTHNTLQESEVMLKHESTKTVKSHIEPKARGHTVCIGDMLGSVQVQDSTVVTTKTSRTVAAEDGAKQDDIHLASGTSAVITEGDGAHSDSEESVNSLLDKLDFRYPSEVVDPVVPQTEGITQDAVEHESTKVEIIREYKQKSSSNQSSGEEDKSDELVIYPTETKVTKVTFEKPVCSPEEANEPKRKLVRHLVTSAEDLLYPDLIQSAKERKKSEGIGDLLSSMLGCSLPELCGSPPMTKSLTEQSGNEASVAVNIMSKSESEASNRDHEHSDISVPPARSDSGFDEYNALRSKLEMLSPLGELHVDVGDGNSFSAVQDDVRLSSSITSTSSNTVSAPTTQESDYTDSTSAQGSSDTTTTTQDSDNWLVDYYQVQKLKLPGLSQEISSSNEDSDDTMTDTTVTEVDATRSKNKPVAVMHIQQLQLPEISLKLSPSFPSSEQSDAYSEICDAVLSGSEGAPSTISTSMDSDRASSSSCMSAQPHSPFKVKDDLTKQAVLPRTGLPPVAPHRKLAPLEGASAHAIVNPFSKQQGLAHSYRSTLAQKMKINADKEKESSVCDDIWTPNTKRHAEVHKGKQLSELIQEQKTMFAKLQEMRTSFDELLHEVETVKFDICQDDEGLPGRHISLYENIAKLRPLSGIDHQLADQKQNAQGKSRNTGDGANKEDSTEGSSATDQAPRIYQPRYRAIDEDVHDLSTLYSLTKNESKPMERSISSPVLSPEIPRREEKVSDLTVSSPCLSPDVVRKSKMSQATPTKQKVRVAMEKLRQPAFKSQTLPDDVLKRTEKVRWADMEDSLQVNSEEKRKYSSSPQIGKAFFQDRDSEKGKGNKRDLSTDGDASKRGEALGVRRAFGSSVIRSRSLDSRGHCSGYQVDAYDDDDDDDEEEGDAQYARWRGNRYSEMRHHRTKPLDLEARNKKFRSHLLAKGGKGEKQKTGIGFFSFKRFTQGK